MKRFKPENLEPGLILAGRNPLGPYGIAIRAALGSYTNHDGLIVDHIGRWYVAEAVAPYSRLAPLDEYEYKMNKDGYVCRIWRLVDASDAARAAAAQYFIRNLLSLKYADYSIAKLAIFRLVNRLPWKLRIHGVWCTELVARAWAAAAPGSLNRPDGSEKKNFTPRTLENRLVAGILEDVTPATIEDTTKLKGA